MQEEEIEIIEVQKKYKEKNVFKVYQMYSDHLPEYYQGKSLNQHANALRDSIIISNDSMNYILDRFNKTIQNKRIEHNLVFFVRDIFLSNCTAITRSKYHKCDQYSENPKSPTLIQNLDIEPETPNVYNLNLQRAKYIQEPTPIPMSKIEDRQSQHSQSQKQKQTQQSPRFSVGINQPNIIIKKGKQKPISKFIQIENNPTDMSQDVLRNEKQYKLEIQKQEEEANKQILMEQQKQNINMKTLQNKLKGQYTYDFNGKILKIKQVSSDILPIIDHTPNYSFQDINANLKKKVIRRQGMGQSIISDIQPNSKDETASISSKQIQEEEDDDDKSIQSISIKKTERKQSPLKGNKSAQTDQMYKNYTNAILNLDQLEPMRGVTLYHKFHIKQGPDSVQIETLQDLFQKLSGLQPLDKLKISRSEYRNLVQNGNMNNIGTYKSTKMSQEGLKNWNSLFPQPAEEEVSIITEDFNENTKNQYFTNKSMRSKSDFSKFSSIKINSNKLVKNMIKPDPKQEENLQQMLQKSKSQQQFKETINIPRAISPINDFNRTIINSEEWGKNIFGITMRSSQVPIKIQKKQVQPLLSPRERYRIKNSKIGHYASQQLISQDKQLLSIEKEKRNRK